MADDLTPFEVDVLRVMNGEDVSDMVAGAAMWVAASVLKGRGLAQGHYTITQKGRDFLAGLAGRVVLQEGGGDA